MYLKDFSHFTDLIFLTLVTLASADIWSPPCEHGDIGVLWPNYQHNSMYYKCLAVHQYTSITCPTDMLFSYVFQECVGKENWFPNPQLSELPLSKPDPANVTPAPAKATTKSRVELPVPKTPQHPLTTTTKRQPPVTSRPTPATQPRPDGPPTPPKPIDPITKKPSRPAPPTPKPKNDVPMPPVPPPEETIQPPSNILPAPPSVGRPVPQP